MKKIGIISGSRADYYLLHSFIRKVQEDPEVMLKLLVTGMHLSKEFGNTYKNIENDGFNIDEFVDCLLVGDSRKSMAKSCGIGVIGFAEALKRQNCDVVVVLGDRYEMLAASIAACILGIPLAHIHGGEITEGALDDSFRHAITKLSTLHFTSTEDYRKRVVQLGEFPDRVYNVGALGVDNIKQIQLLDREALCSKLGIDFNSKYFLVTFHPETNTGESLSDSVSNLFSALDKFEDYKIILTMANADTGGRSINLLLENFTRQNPNKYSLHENLGMLLYLSTLKHAEVIIGNSSSGIIEAPILSTPTVDIGDRQKGRLKDRSVINCKAKVDDIYNAIKMAMSESFLNIAFKLPSVYLGSNQDSVSDRVLDVLKKTEISSLSKPFFNVDFKYV